MATRIAYFPGCSLEGTAKEYNQSLTAIAPKLGLQLEELEDWNCCGATAAHSLNHKLSVALPARILALAEKGGHKNIVAPCAACSHRLISARTALAASTDLRKEVEDIIEMPCKGTAQVKNILQVLIEDVGVEKLAAACARKMTGLKIACYYGCLLVRPPKVMQFDDPEAPQSMDQIIKALGGTPVEWGFKTECCGGGFSMCRTDLVCKMTHDILDNAAFEGAEAFSVACPMCQSNLDLRQLNVNEKYNTSFRLPALYITQWIGLCLGISEGELGLDGNYIDARIVAQKAFASAAPAAPAKKEPAAASATK